MTEEASPAEQAGIFLGEAVLLRAAGKRKEAVAKCQEALRLLPDNAEAFEILGDLYLEMRLPEAALEAYRRAREIDSSRPVLETKVARAALAKQKTEAQRRLAEDLVAGRIPKSRTRNPAVAGLLSLLMPGLGQIYNYSWFKAAGLLFAWLLLLRGFAGALRLQGFDLFAVFSAFFSPPALWWTLLLSAVSLYSIIDAALTATRTQAEDTGMV